METRPRLLRICASLALVGLLVLSLVSLALAATTSFPDVPSSHRYYAAITDLASRGVIGGYTNGDFGPDDPVTRQQFAKMIVLAGGYPVSDRDYCYFYDVVKSGPDNLYPDNYVAVCAANGITTGKTPGSFDPYSNITRYQVVSMVVRALDDLEPGLLTSPPAGWQATGVWGKDKTHGANAARAEHNGLLAGLDLAGLAPSANMSRGEVAQVLHNMLDKLSPTTSTTTGSTTTTTTSTTTTGSSTTTTTESGTTTTTESGTTTTSSTTSTTVPSGSQHGWTSLGGSFTGPPCVDAWMEGGIDVFGRGTDGSLWYNWFIDGEGYEWASIGQTMASGSGPASIAWDVTALDVFIRGSDDALWHRQIASEDWDAWESLGGTLTSDPTVASSDSARLDVFARGTNGHLWYVYDDGSGWTAWQDLGGQISSSSSPAAVSSDYGRLDVFVRGVDDALWHLAGDGSTWEAWESLGGTLTSSPAACSWGSDQLWVFARGAGNTLWSKAYSGSWGPWVDEGGAPFLLDPDATAFDSGHVDVVVLGTDNTFWRRTWNGSSWTP